MALWQMDPRQGWSSECRGRARRRWRSAALGLAAVAFGMAAIVGCAGGGAPAKAPESPPDEPAGLIVGGVRVLAAPSPAATPAPGPTPVAARPEPSGAKQSALVATNDAAKNKTVADAPHSAAMLIYTAALSMSVYQVDQGLDAVEKVARGVGGYLSSRQDNAVTVRVPRDRFDDALERIEKLGEVTHRDIKAQDVTDEYVDLAARLKNAYAMRERLSELLARAPAKEALDIEKELGRVTEEIERLEGKLRLLRDQIAFSTITVSFAPMAAQEVRSSSLLAPFPWLQDIGLSSLLNVHQ
jgi:hypothetical protein